MDDSQPAPPTLTDDDRETPLRLRGRLAAARLLLGWERLWPAVRWAACAAGVFLTLALLDVLPWLPGWLHGVILAGSAGALALAAYRGLRGFRWPDEALALRRLESDSGLEHRPLLTLRDRPCSGAGDVGEAREAGDVVAAAVWRAHRRQMAARVQRLRLSLPRPRADGAKAAATRLAVGLALVTAAAVSWGDWGPRLLSAVLPQLDSAGLSQAAVLDIWLTPPDYTGAAPVFLRPAQTGGAAIAVPVGSAVLARVSGGAGTPALTVNGAETRFSAVDDNHFQIQETVRSGDAISVRQGGRTLGRWTLALIPDAVPAVAFTGPPVATGRGVLRLDYQASDDYGVAGVSASVRLDPKAAPVPDAGAEPVVLPLPLSGLNQKSVHGAGFHDLTAGPLAGLPVLIRLLATDTGGQTGVSDEMPVVLPERVFANPLAREIVAQRKLLAVKGLPGRAAVAQALSALSVRPGAYHDDAVVFLALRVSVAQLLLDGTAGMIPAVRDLLWDTALRLEDGGLSLAERDLRQAEQALAEALDHNAPDQEVRQRMDDLQAALDRFLESLERQMGEAERGGAEPPPAGAPLVLDREDLDAMMRTLRDAAETGGRDGARQMLSNLRQLLEGLRSGGGPAGGTLSQSQNLEALQQLQDVTRRQRDLLDRSYRDSEAPSPSQPESSPPPAGGLPLPLPNPLGLSAPQGQQGGAGTGGAGSAAGAQGQLRQELGGVMQRLGELNGDIPQPLGQAERAMHDAEQALSGGNPDAAVQAQTQAVDNLQQGMRSLSQMLMAKMMGGGGGPGGGRDPLGRLRPGRTSVDSADIRLPEQRELQRAREILDELRRRAGQRERSRQELDYIDRLLRQF